MFTFKQFVIRQERTAMKVGTDGVLLGAWVDVKPEFEEILDIGCGTGLISLMLAQRSAAHIDGVEIDAASSEQAVENVAASQWSERVEVHHSAIQDFQPDRQYDLIVSNPPYFNNSLLTPSLERSRARHTTELSFEELILSAKRLLKSTGRLAIILPTQEAHQFDMLAASHLFLKRRCEVSTREGVAPKRILSEYTLSPNQYPEIEKLAIHGDGLRGYSIDYLTLTSDFYLYG